MKSVESGQSTLQLCWDSVTCDQSAEEERGGGRTGQRKNDFPSSSPKDLYSEGVGNDHERRT